MSQLPFSTYVSTQMFINEKRRAVLSVSFANVTLEFDRVTSVGRRGDIRVFRNCPWVAAQHMEIIAKRNGEVCIRDIGSAAGVFVNGVRIVSGIWIELDQTDSVSLGESLPLRLKRTWAQTTNRLCLWASPYEVNDATLHGQPGAV